MARKKTSKKKRTAASRADQPARRLQNKAAEPVRSSARFSPFQFPAGQLERDLATGSSPGLLQDYFGPESYSELRDLARNAAARSVRGGPRVLILPGIMGSTLAQKALGIDDVLWINPVEIALGRLTRLKLDGTASPYFADGVILFAYLKLKLRLKIAGFDADFFPYDWRMPLTDAGKKLADALKSADKPVSLVAHSMGGLVARAALRSASDKAARLIMLGTPNYGSFAPVQALRGTYDVVQKICKLDRRHTPEQLAGDVFSTFPGLYQMLPSPEKFTSVNLYDPNSWPKKGPQPSAGLLSGVSSAISQLAPADSRFYLIAGVNQPTVVDLHPDSDEFAYTISPDGDGTVPLAFAELANIPSNQTYYVEEGHGSLPNNGAVEDAVIDLLSNGVTTALPSTRPAPSRAVRTVGESELRQMAREAPGIGQLGTSDFRHLLDSVAAPPAAARAAASVAGVEETGASARAAGAPAVAQFQSLVVGRRRQRRIELTLAHGSITEADSRAYVLGVFQNVAPTGAASAIDQKLDGVISEFTARRLFVGDIGEVFTLPCNGSRLGADMVLFAGLGPFDHFSSDVQQLVAENIIRVLVRSRVDEFATVLIGAGSGLSAATVLENLMAGFFRGLQDADPHHKFRAITLCETDQSRYNELKASLFRLAGTPLCNEIEITMNEVELPPPSIPAAPLVVSKGPEPVYLMVRQEQQDKGILRLSASLLGAGMKAAVVTARTGVSARDLSNVLARLDSIPDAGGMLEIGQNLVELLIPEEVCSVLDSMRDRHLVLVHDAEMSRVPWELMTSKGWSFSVENGLSRRYLAGDLPIAAWLEQRRAEPVLKLLLIANPLGDLDGAEQEADRIAVLAKSSASIQVTELRRQNATRAAIVAQLRTGAYDVVHYAGHAFFDEKTPGRSGLLCANREVLSGADLRGLSNLPFLVFFNACEAGRVRDAKTPKDGVAPSRRIKESYSVAETLMRGGVANYLSTYWPVGDSAAKTFSETFYGSILAGGAIGAALLKGRQAVKDVAKSRDWGDYILYGSYDFILKRSKDR